MSEQPPAGWYPDSTGTTRWWDGEQWTEHTPPPPPTQAASPEAPSERALTTAAPESTTRTQAPVRTHADAKAEKAYAKASRPWFKKKRFILPLGLVALIVIFAGTSGGGDNTTATDDSPSQSSDTGTQDEAPAEEQSEPEMTAGQRNALRSAENYLSVAPFSRKGLIQQLSSDAGDGYSKKNATFAADHVEVSWKEQAAKAAKNYLEISGFSRQGLIQQLTSDAGDGYTRKQADVWRRQGWPLTQLSRRASWPARLSS